MSSKGSRSSKLTLRPLQLPTYGEFILICLGPHVFLGPFISILTGRTSKVARKGKKGICKRILQKRQRTDFTMFTNRLEKSHLWYMMTTTLRCSVVVSGFHELGMSPYLYVFSSPSSIGFSMARTLLRAPSFYFVMYETFFDSLGIQFPFTKFECGLLTHINLAHI